MTNEKVVVSHPKPTFFEGFIMFTYFNISFLYKYLV